MKSRTLENLNQLAIPLALAAAASGMTSHASAQNSVLEEVIVTAQKREQNLQDVAISVSAVTERGLERAGIATTDDLNVVVPGLNVTRQLSSFAPILRGVGNYISAPGAEGAIAVYVDGIYLPSAYGSVMSLANVDRVEVLRGPQGTLFGRNATGGLIHVITKTPEFEPSGSAYVSYGSQDTTESKVYVTGGLSDNVAMDFSVFYRDQGDGFGTNLTTGSDTVFRDELAIRSKIIVDMSQTTRLTLAADFADSETDAGLNRRAAEGTVNFFGEPPPADYHDLSTAEDHVSENEQWGITGKFESSLSGFDLLAAVSYRETEAKFSTDQGEASIPFVNIDLPTESESVSAELQISSNNASRVQWIGGIYYFSDDAGVYPFFITGPGVPFASNGITNIQQSESLAIFGETTVDLSEATTLTIGARLTRDERDYSSQTTILPSPPFPGALPTFTDSEEWTEPTWRLSLDHRLNESVMLYGSYSRGFKSGIFNLFGGPTPAVEPEILDAFEVGVKSELMDGRVRLNAAAYYYEYDELQLTTQVQGSAVLLNAANAEIKGLDVELSALLTDKVELNASFAWNDAEFVDFPTAELTTRRGTDPSCPALPGPVGPANCSTVGNAAGNTLPRAPELTANIGLSYETEVAAGSLGAYFTYYYNDGFYNEFANRDNYKQDSYSLLNGGGFLAFGADREWRATVYFRNLTDEEYYTYGTATGIGDFIAPAFGRQYGVGIEYSF